jgi:hypothetical protein
MTNKLNNFFMIIGAAKCATTSLADWLNQHPQITMSSPKEPRFIGCEYPLGLDFYMDKYFANGTAEFNGEANVYNMLYRFAPDRIEQAFGPETKIIMCVRDRVDRFISEWANWHFMRPGRFPWGLAETVNWSIDNFDLDYFNCEARVCRDRDVMGGSYRHLMLEAGLYKYYLNRFARFSTLVVDFDDIICSPQMTYDRVTKFIGCDQHFEPSFNHLKKTNSKFEVDPRIRERLEHFYYMAENSLHLSS